MAIHTGVKAFELPGQICLPTSANPGRNVNKLIVVAELCFNCDALKLSAQDTISCDIVSAIRTQVSANIRHVCVYDQWSSHDALCSSRKKVPSGRVAFGHAVV
jgi:hypothetical protein